MVSISVRKGMRMPSLDPELEKFKTTPEFGMVGSAQALIRRISGEANVDFADVKALFDKLPPAITPLLSNPIGWHVIAAAMGFNYAPTVH